MMNILPGRAEEAMEGCPLSAITHHLHESQALITGLQQPIRYSYPAPIGSVVYDELVLGALLLDKGK